MSGITVRKGVKDDISNLHRLYKKLIIGERIIPDIIIDEEVLLRNGFGERPFFEFIVAEATDDSGNVETVGFAMYYFQFSAFAGRAIYMEAIYVEPAHQKKGIGKTLWQHIVRIALENNCVRCIFGVFGWNTKAIEFYKKHGAVDFTVEHEDHIFHMTKDSMVKFVAS